VPKGQGDLSNAVIYTGTKFQFHFQKCKISNKVVDTSKKKDFIKIQ